MVKMKNDELIKKCESYEPNSNSEVGEICKSLLNNMKNSDEDLKTSNGEIETYLQMVENLSPKDLTKVLKLAMDISSDNNIKNTELKRDASRLIRAIQMS